MTDALWGLARGLLVVAGSAVLLVPAWWMAGRLQSHGRRSPALQALAAVGLALVSYLTVVNLVGRLTGSSYVAVSLCLLLHLGATVWLVRHDRPALDPGPLLASWRLWCGPLVVALTLGLPQWLLGVSTNYWDEANSSAIYLTAPHQFADGVFPPRHNAFPDVPLKYHYAFTVLAGSVTAVSGLSPNVAIDVVSSALWLMAFLFVYFWLRDLMFGVLPALWGSVATLMGGGLSWLYLPWIEAYSSGGFYKVPPAQDLRHRFNPSLSWWDNLMASAATPSQHLRLADGSLANLPWDVTALFQQHAAAAGVALTPLALYLLLRLLQRPGFHWPLLLLNVATFSVLVLAHAVFGSMAVGTAGVALFLHWLQHRSRERLWKVAGFSVGVVFLAPLHGGMLAMGDVYGPAAALAVVRSHWGYVSGNLLDLMNWHVAGFGLPLLLTIWAGVDAWRVRRAGAAVPAQNLFALVLGVFAVVSYLIPQVVYYAPDANAAEEFTEISKFFFCTRFGLALLSVRGIAALPQRAQQWVLAPALVATTLTPVAFCFAESTDARGRWVGFYQGPYIGGRANVEAQMGLELRRQVASRQETYFDASIDDEFRFLSGPLMFGGSVFTLTPTGFERNGIGFRLSQEVVADRLVQNSRMTRLAPGAAESSGTRWYYSRPAVDHVVSPPIVRSRFAKLRETGVFAEVHRVGARSLFAIRGTTVDVDADVERYWAPRIVAQTAADSDGDGRSDLLFFDLSTRRIVGGAFGTSGPQAPAGEFGTLMVGHRPGDARVDVFSGRMGDAVYKRGRRLSDLRDYNPWRWQSFDSVTGQWSPEEERWLWDFHTPLLADLAGSGTSQLIAYERRSGHWVDIAGARLDGPSLPKGQRPLPFGGRFLAGSAGDLGLWSPQSGQVLIKSAAGPAALDVRFPVDGDLILVPGDYDGAGVDQVAYWRRSTRTWQWRRPDGGYTSAVFGSPTGIPLPWDYNGDRRLDLAYWEPAARTISVSFDRGRTVALTIAVPEHAIPAFVNMY
jgi:hypothetical protein